MTTTKSSNAVQAVTRLILAVFRFNGRLVAGGDRLVGAVGLTSARWQVLGALVLRDGKATVSDAARVMGLTRQAVQRLATAMIAEGLIETTPNPRHARAPLLRLSSKGRAAYAAAARRQAPWARELAKGVTIAQLDSSQTLIATLAARLEHQAAGRTEARRGRVPKALSVATRTSTTRKERA